MVGHPRPEFVLERAQPKEEMLGFTQRRRGTGHRRHGVLQVHGRVCGAAVLARVPVLVRGPAGRTLAAHVAIRQEHLPLVVVGLGDDPAVDVPVLLQAPVHLRGELQVFRGVGGLVVVDADFEILEILSVPLGNLGDKGFGRDACLIGPQHGRRTVRVAGADIDAMMTAHALESHPDVGLGVFHQVPQVQRTAGIGQGAGYQDVAFGDHSVELRRTRRKRS